MGLSDWMELVYLHSFIPPDSLVKELLDYYLTYVMDIKIQIHYINFPNILPLLLLILIFSIETQVPTPFFLNFFELLLSFSGEGQYRSTVPIHQLVD
jgi:hypothetical protein